MSEVVINEIIDFVKKFDKDSIPKNGEFDEGKARLYLRFLKKNTNKDNAYIRALIDKLNIIITQIKLNSNNILELFENTGSLSEYIISLIKEKHLTDPKLIARCAYIELSKYLYYDISVTRTTDLNIRKIVIETPIDSKKAKLFSYVLCTHWFELYKYILQNFGINVKKMHRPFEEHVWGEIELNNDFIIIVDATDYIISSIDLSNAKSMSPTTGFLILPRKYSGLKFQEVYTNNAYKSTLDEIRKYYEENRDLDMTLGYIDSYFYPIERILNENDLFKRSNEIIKNPEEAREFIRKTQKFLTSLHIPNNMDGYEVFSYYHMFVKKLPVNIRGNISMKTLFADTYEYKQKRLRRKYLSTDEEYLKYLNNLVYGRYYRYLSDNETNDLLSNIQRGTMSNEELTKIILEQELKVAEINKRLNPYYAVNELIIYNPFSLENSDLYQLYEPAVGRKTFENLEVETEYKKLNKILL